VIECRFESNVDLCEARRCDDRLDTAFAWGEIGVLGDIGCAAACIDSTVVGITPLTATSPCHPLRRRNRDGVLAI